MFLKSNWCSSVSKLSLSRHSLKKYILIIGIYAKYCLLNLLSQCRLLTFSCLASSCSLVLGCAIVHLQKNDFIIKIVLQKIFVYLGRHMVIFHWRGMVTGLPKNIRLQRRFFQFFFQIIFILKFQVVIKVSSFVGSTVWYSYFNIFLQ